MSDFKAKMHQIHFSVELHPRPCWGSLQYSPDPVLYSLYCILWSSQRVAELWRFMCFQNRHLAFLEIKSFIIWSTIPENPILEPHRISHLSANRLRSYGHFVYPVWPTAAILNFWKSKIAPVDRPTPKTRHTKSKHHVSILYTTWVMLV